ncbi:hypothetical protein PoB_005484000 [Plakobranchus ocellatus]|uniref:Uncharacterized protein n=1 Tax=Plakobranchus ocellatus TaxID=259542 RepID=A0AAV4CA98_9GAST|nr:hypothetical protein PoB_005484000 [Plakobranchus ocellatus]
MNELVAEHEKGVYERLTDLSLLKRCLLSKTQNSNESLHSLICAHCPKHLWSGYKRVFIASLLGVAEFNMGTRIFLDRVGTEKSVELGERRDRKRIHRAETAATETAKKRREVKNLAQHRENLRKENLEGGPSYAPGAGLIFLFVFGLLS